MANHHVLWLPSEDDCVWDTVRRILDLLETTPASRVAALLTREGVPPPDAGRERTDRGVRHATSGVWHQVTVTGTARNPLLRAVVAYGRRSMGDVLRFTKLQRRELTDGDLRADGKPKRVVNPAADRITAPTRFTPPVEPGGVEQLVQVLDRRGGTQRGKPRATDPARNPLGCRVFDIACGWPMYRQPYNGSCRYACGLYQQSHGAACEHNTVDRVRATRFLLACIRQRVLAPGFRDRLRRALEKRAQAERSQARPARDAATALTASLAEVRRKRQLAADNMALAETKDQYRAVAAVFEQLREQEGSLVEQLRAAKQELPPVGSGSIAEVDAALSALDRLAPWPRTRRP